MLKVTSLICSLKFHSKNIDSVFFCTFSICLIKLNDDPHSPNVCVFIPIFETPVPFSMIIVASRQMIQMKRVW